MATKKILTDLDVDGKIDVDGTVLGSNLSGTNTGDQDLSGYALTTDLDDYLLNTTDTFTGTHTGDILHLGGSQIAGSSASLQVNGFQRTGSIYIHEGANSPTANSKALRNTAGALEWDGNDIWHAGNLTISGTNTGDQVSSDFTHDDLTGFVSNEHIDWTTDQGATNIHANNYTDTNTTYTAGNGLELSGNTFQVNGGVIGGTDDLDDYDESGYYTQNQNSGAINGTNYPVGKAGVLTVVVANGNTVHLTQTYDQYDSSAFYNRSYFNGTWSSWRNLAQDTNTTYTSSDFTHGALTGVVANEHIDWTTDQGATNIHANNYTNTNETNLTSTHLSTSVTINSDTGTDATINAASGSAAGVVTNGTQTFGGSKTFAGQTTFDNDVVVQEDGASSHDFVFNSKQGGTSSNLTQAKIYSYAGSTDYEAAMIIGTQAGSISIEPSIRIEAENNDVFFYEDVTVAGVIKKNGGTSSQFLKADGSVDSNTYLTSASANLSTSYSINSVTVNSSAGTNATINGASSTTAGVMTTGAQTIGGDKTFSGSLETPSLTVDSGGDRLMSINDSGYFYIGDLDGVGDEHWIEGSVSGIQMFIGGNEHFRLTNTGVAHFDDDVIAYSTTISDRRLKDNIETIDNASETIKKLRGVSYVWNAGNRKGQKEIGLVAQEVEEVLPFLVREHELPLTEGTTEGELYKTVDYEKLVGLLIEDSKEKDARIERLEAMVELMLKQK